jgi:glycolate oxidase FAD binding subunit
MTAHDVLPRTQSGRIFAPEREEEAAEWLRAARSRRRRLRLCGGDTRSRPRPEDPVDTLSSRRLCGVLRHDPRDRLIVARAGTPLQAVVELLARQGQRLPFEPPDHRELLRRQGTPTIGAVAAANVTGPRGLDGGEARSHLLAVRLLNGRAETIRCGTATLKDVAGLDLTRLVAGSLGRLGLITEVAFRVEPVPERELTIRVAASAEALLHWSTRARVRGIRLTGGVWVDGTSMRRAGYDECGGSIFLRLEGPPALVAAHRRRLLDLLPAEVEEVEESSDLASAAIWARLRDGSFLPSVEGDDVWEWRLEDLAGALDTALPFDEPGLSWQLDLGARRLLCVVGTGQQSDRLTCLASAARPRCGPALLRGPGTSAHAPRIPRPRSAIQALEHTVLASFDPDQLLA